MIPFFSISYGTIPPVEHSISIEESSVVFNKIQEKKYLFNLQNFALGIYLMVVLILFARFSFSLLSLNREIINGKKIKDVKFIFILKEEKATPHSFLNYIFLNKNDFESGRIDQKIIEHEKTHALQKHASDILFIEFLLVIFWFNPCLLYTSRCV